MSDTSALSPQPDAMMDAGARPPIEAAPAAPAEPQERDFDDVFGAQDFDQVFKPQKPAALMPFNLDGEQWKAYLHSGTTGAVIRAFGDAFTGPGMSESLSEDLRKAGVFNSVQPEQQAITDSFGQTIMRGAVNTMRTVNEAVLNPVIGGLDVAARLFGGISALPAEYGKAMVEPGSDSGTGYPALNEALRLPSLMRDASAALDMAFTWGHVVPGGAPGAPGVKILTPIEQAAAQAERVRAMTIEAAAPKPPGYAATTAEAIRAEKIGRDRAAALDAKEAAGQPLSEYETAERNWLKTDPHGDAVLRVYPFLRDQLQATAPSNPAALPDPVARARANGVIGEGEAGYYGLREPTEADLAARREADAQVAQEAPPQAAQAAAEAAPEPSKPATVDEVARANAPNLFKEYDYLGRGRKTFADWLEEMRNTAERTIEADPPAELQALDKQIADLETAGPKTGRRGQPSKILTERHETELDDLRTQRAQMLEDLVRDHPYLERPRKLLQETDYRMRDLAPQVSAAYREAEASLPPAEKPAETGPLAEGPAQNQPAASPPGAAGTGPEIAAAQESPALAAARAQGEGAAAETERAVGGVPAAEAGQVPAAVTGEPGPRLNASGPVTSPAQVQAIASDVTARLVERGQSRELAAANAEIVAAWYDTWAQRMGGRLGSAEEMYRRISPEITPERQLELAQSRGLDQSAAPAVGTPEFKKWFGDSKVVDADGAPLVVYHGTDSPFDAFDPGARGKSTGAKSGKAGFWFTDNRDTARGYGEHAQGKPVRDLIAASEKAERAGDHDKAADFMRQAEDAEFSAKADPHVVEGYLSIKNPHVVDAEGARFLDFDDQIHKAIADAKRNGNDGVIIKNLDDNADWGSGRVATHYLAFEPEQIKSVHNRGTYDPKNPNILEQSGRGGITGVWEEAPRIIRMAKSADASTFMHEISHSWLEDLMTFAAHPEAPADVVADAKTIMDWLGVKDRTDLAAKTRDKRGRAVFTGPAKKANEKFARGWERYLMEGRAPTKELATVFAKFRDWLTSIYKTFRNLKVGMSDDVRDVFDRFLTQNPERTVIASETDRRGMADAHESLAESTKPPEAEAALGKAQNEFATHVRENAGEIAHELKLGNDAGERAAQRPGSDGGGAAAGQQRGAGGDVQGPGEIGAGAGPAWPERVETPAVPKQRRSPLDLKTPKEPLRLADWVKKRGGVKGLRDMLAGSRGKVKNGDGLDDLALYAWENGYFPEHSERPSIEEFLAKVQDDVSGTPQYSEFDEAAAHDYRNAIEHNAEVHRLADELGIETKGLSYQEFWEKVGERKSQEDLARDTDHFAGLADEALAEAEAEAQGFDENPGRGEPRTLEDLENERRQEETARGPLSREDTPGFPGAVSIDQGQGQEGAGSLRNGAGPAGRGGAEEGAGQRVPAGDQTLVDSTGRILPERLNTGEDVKDAIRASLSRNGDFVEHRRMGMTWEQTLRAADNFGMSPGQFEAWKSGTSATGEEILMLGKLAIQQSEEFNKLAAVARRTRSAEDLMAMSEAMSRLDMIVEAYSGASSEVGRALNAHKILKGAGIENAAAAAELFQSATGRTMEDLLSIADKAAGLNEKGKLAKFLNGIRQPGALDMLIEWRQAAMLWSPRSWARNIIGNTLAMATEVAVHGTAVGVGRVRQALGGTGERAHFDEVMPAVFGLAQGFRNGLRAGKAIMMDESVMDRPHGRSEFGFDIGASEVRKDTQRSRAIPGRTGEIVRKSFGIMSAADAVFKGMAYEYRLNTIAIRQAMKEGHAGEALTTRVTDLTQSPTAEMMVDAKKWSEYQTFNGELNGLLKKFQSLTTEYPGLKIIVPFMRTPVNILKYSAERSPFAFAVKEARENLLGRNGSIARDEAIARVAIGTGIGIATWSLVADGTITGGGPKDPRERAVKYMSGWKPYSARIGGWYVSYTGFEPISTLFGVAADMHEVRDAMKDRDAEHVGGMVFSSITKNFINKTYMSGLSDFFEMVNDPVKYGDDWFTRLAGSFVPSGIAQIGQSFDPDMRDARKTLDGIRDRVGMGQDLMPMRDIFGEPIARGETFGPDFASPFYISRIVKDPVIQEFEKLGIFPSKLDRKIRDVKLTDQQYDDFQRVAGRLTKMRLDALVKSEGWGQIPGHVRRDLLRSTTDHAREQARAAIISQSFGTANNILTKSLEIKRDLSKGFDEKGGR